MLLTELTKFIRDAEEHKDGSAFTWKDEALGQYLAWAFSKDYLFLYLEGKKPMGVSVVYPVSKPYNGTPEELLPSDEDVPKTEEASKDLIVMDTIFKDDKARQTLTSQFMVRYPNWKEQRKFAVRKGVVSLLNNRYFELTKGLNT
jgi:hypothetical protein